MIDEGDTINKPEVHGRQISGARSPREASQRVGGGTGQIRKRRDIADMTSVERFDFAKTYRLGFGKHKGMNLNEIASVDMLYLDWLRKQDWLNESCREALDTFLANPRVATDLAKAAAVDEARQQRGRY
jgi:hypothetical protein